MYVDLITSSHMHHFVSENPEKWGLLLDLALWLIRTSRISPVGYLPLEIMHGYEPRTVREVREFNRDAEVRGLRANLLEIEDPAVLIDRIGSVQDSALVARHEAAERAKERYDKKVRPLMVKEGDEILVFEGMFSKAYGHKFETRWKGPFVVEWVGALGAVGYRVGTAVKTASIDYVKPYFCRGDWHPKSAHGRWGSKPAMEGKNTEEAVELSCFGGWARRGDLTETFGD